MPGKGRPARGKSLRSVRLVVFDFDGVFTDNRVWSNGRGEEWVCCWRGDGLGLERLRRIGVPAWILSTERHPVVQARARKLGLPVIQGVADKAKALELICKKMKVRPSATAFVGNDINDLPALRRAGLAVLVSNATKEVKDGIKWRFLQTTRPGGRGAVREFCDMIFHARQARRISR